MPPVTANNTGMNGAGEQHNDSVRRTTGRLPNHIAVARPYVFQQTIEKCLQDVGVTQTREDMVRLSGVQWIDSARRALRLPVRTFETAVVYYHNFRLSHSDGEYNFLDAAAAALLAACKIEDTIKKSRDILCAAHNMKVARSEEHLSPDNAFFEQPSRVIIGLERLMLEASTFDFRNRHPTQLMIKLAKRYGLTKDSPTVKTAYGICLDLFRTFAPLKQSSPTSAFACLELAGRLLNDRNRDIESGKDYARWGINRAMVMETLLDLLELYTHYRVSTTVGPQFDVDTYLNVRIPLNEELDSKNIPRFTEYHDLSRLKITSPSNNNPPQGPRTNGMPSFQNGTHHNRRTSSKNISPKDTSHASPISSGPNAGPGGSTPTVASGVGIRQKMGERGRDGTVRFMLNPDREREEKAVIHEYEGS